MLTPLYLPLALFLLSLHSSLTGAQNSVGSFFTAIYLNGAPVAYGQTSCSNMGQSQYCCASGQSCAWDDAGKVACCASGYSCQGSAYSSNAGAAGQGQYYTWSSSTWNQAQQTTTVYQSASPNCNCQSSTALNVVPIVPVTVATVLSPKTTSYYNPPTSTSPYTTTTTAVAGQAAVVTSSGSCSQGYTTIVEANVGTPTRIVGCYVIINEGGKRTQGQISGGEVLLEAISFLAIMIGMM